MELTESLLSSNPRTVMKNTDAIRIIIPLLLAMGCRCYSAQSYQLGIISTDVNDSPYEALMIDGASRPYTSLLATDLPITASGAWRGDLPDYNGKAVMVVEMGGITGANLPLSKVQANVQASTTWRALFAQIDRYDVSVAVAPRDLEMTVGDSLTANQHGTNPNVGPIANIVEKVGIFRPDGKWATLMRSGVTERDFKRVPGAFNSIFLCDQVVLAVVKNGAVERTTAVMPADELPEYFKAHILGPPYEPPAGAKTPPPLSGVVSSEAILYAPGFDTARLITWTATDKPLTVKPPVGLSEVLGRTWLARLLAWCVTHLPGGDYIRRYLGDPVFYFGRPVVPQNLALCGGNGYLTDLDSKGAKAGITHEYYIPVDRFQAFRTKMVAILRAWHVDVLHITVGYSPADTGTEMPWARHNVFIFTVTSRPSDDLRVSLRETPVWSRELAVAATAVGGSFDLPSNVRYVTADDIAAAYPGTSDFIAHKMLIDNKMRLHDLLLDKLCPPELLRMGDDWRLERLARWEKVVQAYDTLLARAGKIHVSRLDEISVREDISARRRFLKELVDANEARLNVSLEDGDENRAVTEMEARALPGYLARAYATRWKAIDDASGKLNIARRRVDKRFAESISALLDLADREWGHWRISYFDKSVHFDNPEADAAYTKIYASLRALGKEGSLIDEEMRELQFRNQR